MSEQTNSDCTEEPPTLPFLTRILIETLLALYLVLAGFYWWLTPKGFPVWHCRFWLHSVLPVVIVLIVVFALGAALRRRWWLPVVCLVGSGWAWFGLVQAGRVMFPMESNWFWLYGLVPAVVATAVAWGTHKVVRHRAPVWISVAIVCVAAGWFAIWAQYPPTPGTRPIGTLDVTGIEPVADENLPAVLVVGDEHRFHGPTPQLALDCGSVIIRCEPMMTFDRISPNGFWSLFAPEHRGRILVGYNVLADPERHLFTYSDGSTIELTDKSDAHRIELLAQNRVETKSYSHLNSFATLQISGHKKLALSFSPCGDQLIDVLPADYPTGRPARFAYVDANHVFHVVEATSGEKGPFEELASSALSDDLPFSIGVWDDGRRVATIEMDDWAPQLDTQLSPTAGWGVPVNAIEFQLSGDGPTSVAEVWVTLAATSVGRGWDCVGHVPGTYRNRMVLAVEQD